MIIRKEYIVLMKYFQEIINSEQSGDINVLDDPSLNKHFAQEFKQFTPEENKQLIEFFESEAGKKLFEKSPIIFMEISQEFEKFMEKLMIETIKRHREEGNQ